MRGIQVFDDFVPDVEQYRQAALRMEFRSFEFPHCTFHGIAPTVGLVPDLIVSKFPAAKPTLSFFRKSPYGQEEPHFIHTDVDMGDWSAILYLNPNPPSNDGTTFWKRSGTGAVGHRIPHAYSELGRYTDGWDDYRAVRAKFNRMLVFPSTYFHSRAIPENWGSGDDSRLTQVTFGTGEIFQ